MYLSMYVRMWYAVMHEYLLDNAEERRPSVRKENTRSGRAEQAGQADHPYIAQLSLQSPGSLRLGDAGFAYEYIYVCMYI